MPSGFLDSWSYTLHLPQLSQGLCTCRSLCMECFPLHFTFIISTSPFGSVITSLPPELVVNFPYYILLCTTSLLYSPHFYGHFTFDCDYFINVCLSKEDLSSMMEQLLLLPRNDIFSRFLMTTCWMNEWVNEWIYYSSWLEPTRFWHVGYILKKMVMLGFLGLQKTQC